MSGSTFDIHTERLDLITKVQKLITKLETAELAITALEGDLKVAEFQIKHKHESLEAAEKAQKSAENAYDIALHETEKMFVRMETAEAKLEKITNWLDNNTTHYETVMGNAPVLASVSKKIWYHATDDCDSYPFSEMMNKAMLENGA